MFPVPFRLPPKPIPKEIPAKERHRRAFKPKAKTGCKTCRNRRVKCDETTPECLRCVKFGRKCEGYDRVKMSLDTNTTISPLGFRGFRLTREPSAGLPFRTDMDQLYFESFRYEVVPKMTGGQSTGLWNRIILQACHAEPWVLDSIVAIAALSMSGGVDDSMVSEKHRQVALVRYGRAIRAMRSSLTNEERHLRVTLLGCLLVFCFEGFQGYHKHALLHFNSGYQLLKGWLESKSCGSLVFQTADTRRLSGTVEEELIDVFVQINLQVITACREAWPSYSVQDEKDGDALVANMPEVFSNVEEAWRWMCLIMQRSFMFVGNAADATYFSAGRDTLSRITASETLSSPIDFGTSCHTPFQTIPLPRSIILAHDKYANEITRWEKAFNRLHSLSPQPVPAITQIGLDSCRILLNSAIATSECDFDTDLPKHHALLSLIKENMNHISPPSKQATSFFIGFGVLPCLYLICKFCRDGTVRREAISIMGLAPLHEGVWDRALTIRIATWLMEVEEAGMVEGYIAENKRVRITRVHADMSTKCADLEYMRRIDELGGVETSRATIRWEA